MRSVLRRAVCPGAPACLIAPSAAPRYRRRAERRSPACACALPARTSRIGTGLESAAITGAGAKTASFVDKKSASIMSDLDKLKKENKQLKTLLKKAVKLLNDFKDVLKRQQTLATAKKD